LEGLIGCANISFITKGFGKKSLKNKKKRKKVTHTQSANIKNASSLKKTHSKHVFNI